MILKFLYAIHKKESICKDYFHFENVDNRETNLQVKMFLQLDEKSLLYTWLRTGLKVVLLRPTILHWTLFVLLSYLGHHRPTELI